MNINKVQSSKFKVQSLKNQKILITAGPTWVPIDGVRVISNIATGQTGILLAERLQAQGACVTLVLGPGETCCLNKNIKLIRFKFFQGLKDIINRELKAKKYDAIIHSAAVSDFGCRQYLRGKLDSKKIHNLKLVPLPKIIEDIRRLAPEAKLIMFKLEVGVCDATLLQRAKTARLKTGADFIVANRINPYRGFIINGNGKTIPVKSKDGLAERLISILNFHLKPGNRI